MQVIVIERGQQIQVQEQEIVRRERELDAQVRKPAEAEKFRLEKLAEANKWVLGSFLFFLFFAGIGENDFCSSESFAVWVENVVCKKAGMRKKLREKKEQNLGSAVNCMMRTLGAWNRWCWNTSKWETETILLQHHNQLLYSGSFGLVLVNLFSILFKKKHSLVFTYCW